jgi:glycosyltransferase involved in cell wall biosynthesis
MEASPRISIITPSFNQASFLEQTISSVVNQDYPNLEYIVIDGGSTDGSLEIIRKFESSIAYWVSEKDRGQGHAINKGLERATGDIIAYLNSDDYYLEGALDRVANHFASQPEVDLIYGRCRIVDERGAKVDERVGSITRYEEILDLWDVWWNGRNFVQPEVFWTRRIMDKVGPLREDLFWALDYDYWVRIFHAGGVVGFVDSELASFRLHPIQKSTQRELTANELLCTVRPYIFADDAPIGWFKRMELRGKWIFDAKFRREADRSLWQKEFRYQRWLRLVCLSLLHPELLAAPGFRQRLLSTVSNYKPTVSSLNRAND